MQIGIDSFAAAFDESSLAVNASDRLRNLVEQIEHADQVGLDVFGVWAARDLSYGGTTMRRAFTSLTAVTLRFPGSLAPGAKRVAVVGPFNGWDPTVHPLARTMGGDWTITIYLPPGRVIYHFDVDGAAWLDAHDEGRILNAWGSEYSVRYVDSPG